jgi:hypothetical protein
VIKRKGEEHVAKMQRKDETHAKEKQVILAYKIELDTMMHEGCGLLQHSFNNTTGGTLTTIFCLSDLMLKKSEDGTRFSTKAVVLNKNECD